MNATSFQQIPPTQPDEAAFAPAAPKELNLDPVRALRMHRTPALAVFIAVTLLVFAFGLSRKPYYETQALIYVQPQQTEVVSESTTGTYDPNRYESYMQQQLQTIPRPDILAQALAEPQAQAWRAPGVPLQTEVAILHSMLKVQRVEESYEISIGLSGRSPYAIAGMVNAVCDAYIHGERADELAQTNQHLQILDDERDRLNTQLAADRQQQAELSVSLGIADTTASADTGNPYDTELAELRSDLAKAVAEHDLAVADLDALGNPGAAQSVGEAANALISSDPGLTAFKAATAQRSSVIASQMAGLRPENPLYQQDEAELAQLDHSLLQMEQSVRTRAIRLVAQNREQEVRRTAAVVQRLQAQLASNTSVATHATPQLQRAAEISADIKRLQARFNDVDNAINSLELQKDTSGLVHILLPAEPPLAPKTSLKRLILAAAIPLGLIAGLVTAMLLLLLDPRVFIAKDISRTLHFFPMATLPSGTEADKKVSDEFLLRLLAGIDQIHRTDNCKTFVFTTVSEEDHVSAMVESLSRKMQRLGYSIITLKASDLIQEQTLLSGIVPTAISIERQPTRPHENSIFQKLESLRHQADFIFIEARPLLSSSVTEFTARLSDVAVLVVESGRTTRSELRSAFDLVKRLHTPGLAIVLCNVLLRNADTGFIKTMNAAKNGDK